MVYGSVVVVQLPLTADNKKCMGFRSSNLSHCIKLNKRDTDLQAPTTPGINYNVCCTLFFIYLKIISTFLLKKFA